VKVEPGSTSRAVAPAEPGRPANEHAIEARQLTRTFGEKRALDGLDLKVPRGALFALLGPNGAGKSTTIQILTTLLAPTSGSAAVNGCDVLRDPRGVRRSSGVVFQESSLDDRLTARENLLLHAAIFGVPRHERSPRVRDRLAWIGLESSADQIVRTFSGGMRRRLEIARALVHDPTIIVLDEPTVGLDPQTRRVVWDHLAQLASTRDRTVFVTTHYMDEAERCDDVAILDHGRLITRGTPHAIMAQTGASRLEDAFVTLTGHAMRDGVDDEAGDHNSMRTRLRMRGRG
jgi:ABC-2 type transport system ATP-binding protein